MTTTRVEPPVAPVRDRSTLDVRRLRGVAVVTGAAMLFALLTAAIRLGWEPVQAVDAAAARSLNAGVGPRAWLIRTMTVITRLGGTGVLTWLVVLALILLLTRRRFLLAAYLGITTAGALILDPTLKALVGRLRPVVDHPIAVGGGNSFPS